MPVVRKGEYERSALLLGSQNSGEDEKEKHKSPALNHCRIVRSPVSFLLNAETEKEKSKHALPLNNRRADCSDAHAEDGA